jgi:hypothetical protein
LEEAADNLKRHLRALDLSWGKADDRRTQEALVGIYVELSQLQFHKKEIRRPFERLQDAFYEMQEKSGKGLAPLNKPRKRRLENATSTRNSAGAKKARKDRP